jgi:hypothetical protein
MNTVNAVLHLIGNDMASSLFNKLIKKVKKKKQPQKRTFRQDASLVATLKKVARLQGRSPKAIVDEVAKWNKEDQVRQEKSVVCGVRWHHVSRRLLHWLVSDMIEIK